MRYRKLDSNNDMVFGHGGADYLVNSPQTVAQAIFTTLRLLLGEWFLDTTKGVPWLTQVVGRQKNYDDVVKNAIRGVQGVIEIQDYSSSLDPLGRVLTINQATVITVYGPVTLTNISSLGGFGITPYGYVYGG
jgi:hypothetical protein